MAVVVTRRQVSPERLADLARNTHSRVGLFSTSAPDTGKLVDGLPGYSEKMATPLLVFHD
jgi:hypothetical protein